MGVPIAVVVLLGAIFSVFVLARAALTAMGYDRLLLSAVAGIAVLTYLHALIDFSRQIPGYFIVFGILLGGGLARASSNDGSLAILERGQRTVSSRAQAP
jgi:hypothetical protein